METQQQTFPDLLGNFTCSSKIMEVFHLWLETRWKPSRPGLFFLDAGLFMSPWPWILWCATSCVYVQHPKIPNYDHWLDWKKERKRLFFVGLLGVFLCNNTGCKLQYIVVWCLKRNGTFSYFFNLTVGCGTKKTSHISTNRSFRWNRGPRLALNVKPRTD